MMNRILVAVGVLTIGLALTQVAEAKKGKGRPHMCDAFTESTIVEDGENVKVAICTDGVKPVVLTSYTVLTMKDADGNPIKVALGYR